MRRDTYWKRGRNLYLVVIVPHLTVQAESSIDQLGGVNRDTCFILSYHDCGDWWILWIFNKLAVAVNTFHFLRKEMEKNFFSYDLVVGSGVQKDVVFQLAAEHSHRLLEAVIRLVIVE